MRSCSNAFLTNSIPGILLLFAVALWGGCAARGEGVLEAYARQNEIAPGETVEIAAQADPALTAEWWVRRMAYDDGATKLTFAAGTVELSPRDVKAPDAGTGLVEANWPVSLQIHSGEDWPAGVYVVELKAGKKLTYALFVINDRKPHDFLLQVSLSTYAAYNTWGGLSLYANNSKLPLDRASRVSLDRPLDRNGAGDFFWLEYGLVLWLTRAGYDVGYTTNVGIDADPRQLAKTKMLILSGHDEYWSQGERDAVEKAVAGGMHLTSLSANTAYWKINYLPSSDGRPRRIVECAKYGPLADATHTHEWRNEGRPEGPLHGAQYGWIVDSWVPLVIGDTSDPVFEGTAMRPGDQFFGLMGPETDGYYAPASATVIGTAPLLDIIERLNTGAVTLLRNPSGAQVFNASGIFFSNGLNGPYAHWKVQRLMANVLKVAGKPRIAPYYSPEYSISGVQRWLSSEVTTMARVPEGPRAIVRYDGKTLFTTEANANVYELHDDGSYTVYATAGQRLDALAVDGRDRLYGVSLNANGIYRFDGNEFVRLNAEGSGHNDGALAGAKFSQPVQLGANGKTVLVIEHRRSDSRVRVIENDEVTTLPQPPHVVYTGLPLQDGRVLFGLADNRLWLWTGAKYVQFSGSAAGWNDAAAKDAQYLTPYGMAPTKGGYFAVERYGHRIRFVSSAGGAWTVAGNGAGYEDGRGDHAQFKLPFALLEVNPDEILVTDAGNAAIRKVILKERP
jgi:hypothetical protein